jgi:cytochrome c-type biogenesis protein CcmH/NrfG
MYSQVDRDVTTAKTLLDLAELYIYSMDDLTEEFEVRQMMRAASTTTPESIALSMLAFQHLQAAYLMVCVQFWAGNMVSRKRAIDTRFSVVIKARQKVRNMNFRVLIINIGCKKAGSYKSTPRS